MAELTVAQVAEITAMIANQSNGDFMDDLAFHVDDLAYQGFDPKYLLNILYKRGINANKTIQEITIDLKSLALVGTVCGSSIQKVVGKSTPNVANFLNKIKNEYQIIEGRPRTNNDATLPRISAMFAAAVCVKLHAQPTIRTTVDPTVIHDRFPKCMCISTFGALIPRDGVLETDVTKLTKGFCYHQYRFDRIIKPNPAQHTTKDAISKNLRLAELNLLKSRC